MSARPAWSKMPFVEARLFLLSKRVITRRAFDRLEAAARVRAFTVTGVQKLDILQRILDSLDDALRTGQSLGRWIDGFDELMETSGVDPLNAWRAETIFRTNVQSAYGRGRWEQGATDPEFWGWRFNTVGDDRVRPEHEALEGHVFEKGEGVAFFPPIDFNCRCSAEWILQAEAEAEGLTGGDPVPQEAADAVERTSFASPALGEELTVDLGEYDGALARDFMVDRAVTLGRAG